ncbi:hypothetical protein ACLKA6_003309 [Drosophila palustris]
MEQAKDVDINSKLDAFLARQHRQSSSSLSVAQTRFSFWPTPETLRSIIANSSFRYQSLAGSNLVSQPCPVSSNVNNPGDNTELESMRMSGKKKADNVDETESQATAASTSTSTQNPRSTATSTPNLNLNPYPRPSTATGGDIRREMFAELVFYSPIILLLLLKFLYDYWWDVFDVLLLLIVFGHLNRTLPLQVARLTDQKQIGILLRDFVVGLIVVVARLYLATAPPDPFGLILPPFVMSGFTLEFTEPPVDKAISLRLLLYHAIVSDLVLKLITILIKILITMLPLKNMKFRARIYALLEYIFQLYRCLTPITQWLMYFYRSYPDMDYIADILKWLYIVIKFVEFLLRLTLLKHAVGNFRTKNDSIRLPTKDELDAADSMCPICNDPYNAPIILECRHIFCDQCVRTWFKREPTCPMCRAKVSDDPKWQDGSTTTFFQLY